MERQTDTWRDRQTDGQTDGMQYLMWPLGRAALCIININNKNNNRSIYRSCNMTNYKALKITAMQKRRQETCFVQKTAAIRPSSSRRPCCQRRQALVPVIQRSSCSQDLMNCGRCWNKPKRAQNYTTAATSHTWHNVKIVETTKQYEASTRCSGITLTNPANFLTCEHVSKLA